MFCMRTTLDLPDGLVEQAQAILGFKSKTDAVIVSLRELIRRKQIEELKGLFGQREITVDLVASRRRPSKTR